jgi:DNA-binding transcriptional LysR family regulator
MPTKLPSLYALQVFEAAARHQHFSRAAAEMNLSQGAISYQIRLLEEDLGFALFDRVGRSVRLSRQGSELLPVLQSGFSQIENVLNRIKREMQSDVREVVLATTTYFASRWLLKRLARFMAAHPDIGVRLVHSAAHGDRTPRTTLEIRWGDGNWPDVHAVKLFDADIMPVCAPRLVTDRPGRLHVDDLKELRFLHDEEMKEAWRRWQEAAGAKQPAMLAGPVIIDPNVRMQAAVDGQGVALADHLVREELESGQLVVPIEFYQSGYGYYLIYHERPEPMSADAAFAEWLLTETR